MNNELEKNDPAWVRALLLVVCMLVGGGAFGAAGAFWPVYTAYFDADSTDYSQRNARRQLSTDTAANFKMRFWIGAAGGAAAGALLWYRCTRDVEQDLLRRKRSE
jgi:hypothetical protein